jgi:molybdate transport system permease protein
MDAPWTPLLLSMKVAGWATFLNLIFGVGTAFFLARYKFPGRNLFEALLTLPMVLPPTVLGYYLLVLLGSQSWFGSWLLEIFGINLIFTWQAAVFAAFIVAFPLVLKPARAAFEDVDIQFEQAAKVLGLSNIAIFFRITLPLAWRGVLAGLLLGFARALGEFGATLMIAGSIPGKTQTLSIAVYEAVQAGKDHEATILVVITSVVCITVLLIASHFTARKGHQR